MGDDLRLDTPKGFEGPAPKGPAKAKKAPRKFAEYLDRHDDTIHARGDDQLRCSHGEHYRACRDCHPAPGSPKRWQSAGR